MLKIDRTIRRKDIGRHVWTQLRPVPISEVKTWIFFLTFLMLDTLCVLPVIGNKYVSGYFFAVIIPTALINIWAITILVRNFILSKKKLFILFQQIVLFQHSVVLQSLRKLFIQILKQNLLLFLLFLFFFISVGLVISLSIFSENTPI